MKSPRFQLFFHEVQGTTWAYAIDSAAQVAHVSKWYGYDVCEAARAMPVEAARAHARARKGTWDKRGEGDTIGLLYLERGSASYAACAKALNA